MKTLYNTLTELCASYQSIWGKPPTHIYLPPGTYHSLQKEMNISTTKTPFTVYGAEVHIDDTINEGSIYLTAWEPESL
jgi:hypothetical protein